MKSILSETHYHSEEAAYAYIEARIWPEGPICPHCGATNEHVGRLNGKTTRIGLYKCYGCRQPFNVKVGTVFEKSHVPMRHWLQTMYLMSASKKGISTRQIQRTFQCSMKTAWFLTHRVREAMAELRVGDTDPLGGANQVVESDETFVGGKAANRKARETESVTVVFDQDFEFARRRLGLFHTLGRFNRRGAERCAGIMFADAERYIPLQAADLLAWTARSSLSEIRRIIREKQNSCALPKAFCARRKDHAKPPNPRLRQNQLASRP